MRGHVPIGNSSIGSAVALQNWMYVDNLYNAFKVRQYMELM